MIRATKNLQSLAERITRQITQGVKKPLSRVTDVSSCEPHRAGMAPISFVRQVLAVCLHPELPEEPSLPPDVRQKVQRLLGVCDGGSVGGYMEVIDMDPEVNNYFKNMQYSPPVISQLALEVMST